MRTEKLEHDVESARDELETHKQMVMTSQEGQKERFKVGLKKYADKKHKKLRKQLAEAENKLTEYQARHAGDKLKSAVRFKTELQKVEHDLENRLAKAQNEFDEYQKKVRDDQARQKARFKKGLKKYAEKKFKSLRNELEQAKLELTTHRAKYWGSRLRQTSLYKTQLERMQTELDNKLEFAREKELNKVSKFSEILRPFKIQKIW